MGSTLGLIADVLGIVGGGFAGAMLLRRVAATKRVRIFWGNLKRATIHRVWFVKGWGYQGDVFYAAFVQSPRRFDLGSRIRESFTKSKPDYVMVGIPNNAQPSGPLTFTEMRILWTRNFVQLEFTCEFNEAIISREHFLAIEFHAPGMKTLATSWGSSPYFREGWEIASKSTEILVSLSESWRILQSIRDTGQMNVAVLGFRDGVMQSVGRFDLGKSLYTPVKPWAQFFTSRDSFSLDVSHDEPTDAEEILRYVLLRSGAKNGFGKPPPERRVAIGSSLSMSGRAIVEEEIE